MRPSPQAVVRTTASLALVCAATVVGVWGTVSAARAWSRALAPLTATATGQVTGVVTLPDGTIGSGVRFVDADGVEHDVVLRPGEGPSGYDARVDVRYDPASPVDAVVGDAATYAPGDGTGVATALAVLGALPVLAWGLRWARWSRARRAAPQVLPVQAFVTGDDPEEAAAVRRWHALRRQTWLRIGDGTATPVRYQRVLWDHRVAVLAAGGLAEVARRSPDGPAVVVVDGTGLLPVGRQQVRPPGRPLGPATPPPFSWRALVPQQLPSVGTVLLIVVNLATNRAAWHLAAVMPDRLPRSNGVPAALVGVAVLATAWLWGGPAPRAARDRGRALGAVTVRR